MPVTSLEAFMNQSRRGFIAQLLLGLGGLGLGQLLPPDRPLAKEPPAGESVWCEGQDPYAATVAAVDKLGGMQRFVKPGQRVALLPNAGWARTVEQAACTHPQVVKALIDMTHSAGAKSISVFCNPCNDIRLCLDLSGIGATVDASPARFEVINNRGWRKREAVAGCTFLRSAEIYRLVEDCDVLISAPVAKHHGSSTLTMCCKNLMGLVKDRGIMHQKLQVAIADLAMMVPADLCVLDASRILLRNGPTGGDLKDVKWTNTIVAGTRAPEVDVLGTSLFGIKPEGLEHLRLLGERGFVNLDPARLKVQRIKA
jgi:uncharacterized protein (DUF362 family)